jgi:hypothetical protein
MGFNLNGTTCYPTSNYHMEGPTSIIMLKEKEKERKQKRKRK